MIIRFYKKIIRSLRMKRDPIAYARSIGVSIGDNCRLLGIHDGTFGSEPYLVTLGNHVTITAGVSFVTHDGGVWVFREEQPDIDVFEPIRVGDNVFIGINSIIMPGVSIGNNTVIAAGSVVTKVLSPNAVYAGIPARKIKSIDDYWDKLKDKIYRTKGMSESKKRAVLTKAFKL